MEGIKEKNKAVRDGQFSSEKLLEDELNQRMENGLPTFGRQLKMYRRHGEYGRQYIIPIGRLDLLAEDDEGNLFIIELKKDRGYDDSYAQIRSYIRPLLIVAIGKPDEDVILTEVEDGKTGYYRDEQDRHYVPKRKLEDLVIEHD